MRRGLVGHGSSWAAGQRRSITARGDGATGGNRPNFFAAAAVARAIGRASGGRRRAGLSARAGVAELVDALDLGSSVARRGGSSPSARTRPPRDGRNSCVCRRPPPSLPLNPGPDSMGRGGTRFWKSDDDAGHRDQHPGPQAGISGPAGRPGTRGAPDQRTRRHEGQGAAEGLPPRQGAGRPPAQGLRPLGDGRRRAERRERGESQDRQRQQPEARPRAADRIPSDQQEVEKALDAKADLAFKVPSR